MALINTPLANGADTTIPLNFIPSLIEISDGAAINRLVVQTDDYGIHLNLDTNGVNAMGILENFGAVGLVRRFRLADGNLPLEGKSCQITATLASGANRNLFVRSEKDVTKENAILTKTNIINALADSEVVVQKFSYLSLVNCGANDLITLVYRNGRVESKLHPYQVQAMLAETMGGFDSPTLASVQNPSVIDNTNQIFDSVRIQPASTINLYVQRLQSVAELRSI